MAEPVVIVGMGAFTPIGVNAMENAASFFSGYSGKRLSSIYNLQPGLLSLGYVPSGMFPPLVEDLVNLPLNHTQRRILRLAAIALDEASEALPPQTYAKGIWAAPRPDAGRPSVVTPELVASIGIQTDGLCSKENVDIIANGRASFFAGVEQAIDEYLRVRRVRYVMVGGVDSYVDPLRLAILDVAGRLVKSGVSDGFTPGEGAAFLVLTTERIAREDGRTPFARIRAVNTGFEKGHLYSTLPYKGEGLAQTISDLFANARLSEPIQTVFAGFNGENFGAKEWGVSYLRNRDSFAESFRLEHPAEYTGDLGAALAPMMTVVAACGLFDQELLGPVLIFASSDAGERGALLLTAAVR